MAVAAGDLAISACPPPLTHTPDPKGPGLPAQNYYASVRPPSAGAVLLRPG